MNEIRTRTYEEIESEFSNKEDRIKSATPFATSQFGYQSSNYKTKDGKAATVYYTSEAGSSATLQCLYGDGSQYYPVQLIVILASAQL